MLPKTMLFAAVMMGIMAGSVSAQTDNSAVFYRLKDQSTWQRGCFAPCVCAASEPSSIAGTFRLLPLASTADWDVYAVADVKWTVTAGNTRLRVTGQGEYHVRRTGEPAQQLILDLQTDGGLFEHYDSGLVAGGASLPTLDLTVSIYGMYCYDTAIRVVAEPAVRAAVCRLGNEATWQQDCFGACSCAAGEPAVVGGTFLMSAQDYSPPYVTYAVTDVDWVVRAADGLRYITGSGTYQLGGEGVLTQRLQLDLRTNAGAVEHFDSGYVAGGAEFPAIDVTISANDQICVNTAIRVAIRPVGDFNLDGAVDQTDFAWFQACLTGRGKALSDPTCRTADLDGDSDVDQADFGVFQRCITAPGVWIDPACAR